MKTLITTLMALALGSVAAVTYYFKTCQDQFAIVSFRYIARYHCCRHLEPTGRSQNTDDHDYNLH
jgi:hypothetical protein